MSKFVVRANHDGKVRLVEFDRQAQFNLDVLEKTLTQAFKLPGVELRYAPSPSNQQVLRQDFHLDGAFKDALTNRRRFFDLTVVSAAGGNAPRAAAASSSASSSSGSAAGSSSASSSAGAAAGSSAARGLPTQSSGSRLFEALGGASALSGDSAASNVKYCGTCGTAVPAGKFCSSCGSPVVAPISAEAPAGPSMAGRLSAAEKKARRGTAPYPKASTNSKNNCAGCSQSVGIDGVSALEKLWHKDCFVCFMCSTTLLDKGFKRYEDAPVCASCFAEVSGLKCGACDKVISTAYMEIQGKNYHPECFVCSKCTNPFAGGSYLRGKSGEFLCKPCAQEAL